MTINELLEEYNLDPDDIRWSLCRRIAESIRDILDRGDLAALIDELWSGRIGDELYDTEERWIRDRSDRLGRGILDEGHLRDELRQMSLDRLNRRRT